MDMQNRGDATSQTIRDLCRSSEERVKALQDISRFRIPGGDYADNGVLLACDSCLRRGADLLVEWRAFSTWRTYATYITSALEWLRTMVLASGMAWHTSTLIRERRFLAAFSVHVLETSATSYDSL